MTLLPGPHNEMFSYYDSLQDFIRKELEGHKKDLDRSNPRDYIDAFLIEMENVCEELYCAHSTVQLYSSLSNC